MIEFVEHFYILHELQIFKPICNIVTSKNRFTGKTRSVLNSNKKRNIIRQWFQYAVWANRIKKVLLDKPCIELIDLEIISKKQHYSEVMTKIKENKLSFYRVDPKVQEDQSEAKRIMAIASNVIEEFEESKKKQRFEKFKQYYHEFLQRIYINFRFQEINFGKF